MTPDSAQLSQALINAAAPYFEDCRSQIPSFVRRHFHYPGAWQLNKRAFGWDILITPLNLIWAPFYVGIILAGFVLSRCRCQGLARLLLRTPGGIQTQVQRCVTKLIYNELLRKPTHPTECPLQHSIKQSLKNQGLKDSHETSEPQNEQLDEALKTLVEKSLAQYKLTRTASADIGNTLFGTAIGALTVNKFTPGALGVGLIGAAAYAKFFATQNFFLGESLGKIYYHWFPPEPSFMQTLSVTGFVLLIFSIVAAISGLVLDPVQARLGIHRRRLKKLVDQLEADFQQGMTSRFHPKDPYLARVLEAFDVIKTQL